MMCAHTQAAEVRLPGGELVACICTNSECYQQLPSWYITHQQERAWLFAHCQHTEVIDLIDMSVQPDQQEGICNQCGTVAKLTEFDELRAAHA